MLLRADLIRVAVCVLAVFAAVALADATNAPSRCATDCWPQVCHEASATCVDCTATLACASGNTCVSGRCEANNDSSSNILGAVVAVLGTLIVCSVAAVAGVGGGGIMVPLYSTVLGVNLMTAVSLSQATITGMAVLSVSVKFRQRHPDHHDRSIINWTLMTFWLPCSLAGTLIGNLIGKTIPDWFRILLLLTLLSYTLKRVVTRARAQKQLDAEKKSTVNPADDPVPSPAPPPKEAPPQIVVATNTDPAASVAPPPAANGDNQAVVVASSPTPPAPASAAAIAADLSKKDLDWDQTISKFSLVLIALTFLPLMLANYATSQASGWTVCGTSTWWMIIFCAVIYNFVLTAGVRTRLNRIVLETTARAIAGDAHVEPLPFKWNNKTSIWYPIIATTAGAAASLLGIGGGLILSVLFLEAGLIPEEVSSTSGCATLLVATQSLSQFIIQGVVPGNYGIMCFTTGIVSAAVGQFVFVREIKRRQLPFLFIAALAFIMGGSMIALTADGLYSTITKIQNHESLSFTGVCKTTAAVPS